MNQVRWSNALEVDDDERPILIVMAMTVSKDSHFALTVSADNLIGKYDLVSEKMFGCSSIT